MPTHGYFVSGLDHDPKWIVDVICDKRFICFRNKTTVPADELVQFYQSIGTVGRQDEEFMSDEYVETYCEGHRELIAVRNKDISGYGENGLFAGDEEGLVEWHCASQNREYSEEITAFSIRQMGDDGGITSISDNRSPYYSMSKGFQEIIDDIQVKFEVSDFAWSTPESFNALKFKNIGGETLPELEVRSKPIVMEHPIDGKKGLHYSWPIVTAYVDYDDKEFQYIHGEILSHILNPDYIYNHMWEEGDIILNEQYHSLHKRDQYKGDRLLYRSAIYVT